MFAVPSNHDDFISEISQMYIEVLESEMERPLEEKLDIETLFANTDWNKILENDIER